MKSLTNVDQVDDRIEFGNKIDGLRHSDKNKGKIMNFEQNRWDLWHTIW